MNQSKVEFALLSFLWYHFRGRLNGMDVKDKREIETNPTASSSAAVSVTRCVDYQSENIALAVIRQFSLWGGLEKFVTKGDSVLIKPNFIVAAPSRRAVQTDPALIIAVARLLKDFGARPFVADSPAWNDIATCIRQLELEEPLRKLDVPVRKMNQPERIRLAGTRIGISRSALQADKIINLPKFKTHQQLFASFAVKNMFGCVSGKEKAFWHFARGRSWKAFCEMLIEIYRYLSPVFTIIDGVIALEGMGPIHGRPKPLGFLIGGIDPLACERVCCELVRFDPDDLPIIRTARRLNFGCSDLDKINIVGDEFSGCVCEDFQPAELRPINFSLLHVCRSVARQALLLTRSALKRNSS